MKEFVSEIKVEWAHCDFAGIVFYPTFYIWFDQGTERLFAANGLSYAELREDFGIDGMPLLETGTTYKNEANWDPISRLQAGSMRGKARPS